MTTDSNEQTANPFDVERFMQKAQRAGREALFAALQAAMVSLVDAKYGGPVTDETLTHVEERLTVGKPYGAEIVWSPDPFPNPRRIDPLEVIREAEEGRR